ncbi:TPA: hypothetical protein N0F65_010952 [Lagenidium giganteum]|uniref:Uncharacterized protein n=1 Tax=Lagenidium giganteum TaxID=4803 RepID=A0AAV2ZCY9_9STRA|nr:TPA: hypothetical protein N0F65_010952 [Lagenidium giganteum]
MALKLSLAQTLLMRRRDPRQRFDSADYAMGQQAKAVQCMDLPPAGVPGVSTHVEDGHQVEQEPEPEGTSPMNRKRSHSGDNGKTTLSRNSSTSTSASSIGMSPMAAQVPAFTGEYPAQQVRRIRLQRFDSADWAMQNHENANASRSPTSKQKPSEAMRPQHAVAQLLLDRHSYKTCHFVSTPVNRTLCAEKA